MTASAAERVDSRLASAGLLFAWLALAVIISGCSTVGPATVQRDRTNYSEVLAATWKEQTLLNIVKLRYGDVPLYIDVSSVITSSSIEGQVTLGAEFNNNTSLDSQTLGMYGRYTDRPTITYTPLTGDKFSRYLLRPMPPISIFSMVQAGYPVDRVVQLTTRGINGVYNRSMAPARARAADPEFYRLIDAWRRLQQSEALGMRIERRGADEVVLIIFPSELSEAQKQDLSTVREILHLDGTPGQGELSLTYGMVPRSGSEIAMLTRSMAEIFLEIAATIDAPPEHVEQGRANPLAAIAGPASHWDEPPVRVHSGVERPADAYAAVRYRDHWFWIDDRDLRSKSVFTFILVLFSMAETGGTAAVPMITVPAN